MQIPIVYDIKKAGTIILTPTIVLLGFVWSYLEKVLPIKSKQELETIYLIQIISTAIIILFALSAFVAFLLLRTKKEIKKENEKQMGITAIKQNPEEQFTYEILYHILQIKGFNQLATPRTLVSAIDSKPEVILERLNKLHNEQYVTFQTGGKPPTLDTDFFLSPKAFEIIKIFPVRAPSSKTLGRRVISKGIENI